MTGKGEGLDHVALTAALRLEQQQLDVLFQIVSDGLVVVDASGAPTRWNRAAETLLGRTPAQIEARLNDPDAWDVRNLAGERLPQDACPVRRVLKTGEPLTSESISVHRPDGSSVALSMDAAPIRDDSGAIVGAIGLFRDSTERLRAESALRDARELAERASEAKNEFLSRMSHDLRTPLNAILGFAQLLAADAASASEASVQILKAGGHLLELINEVLDIVRIEAGHLLLSVEPVQVRDTVESALRAVRPIADEQRISVAVSGTDLDAAWVRADRPRLRQVLLNLLGNAVKYNRPHGHVDVRWDEASPGRLRISVSDTGRGIAPDKRGLLFHPFERLGAEGMDIEGTGLGLALVKGLIEAMDGRVGVESAVGRGSTFWVELQTSDAPPAGLAANARVRPLSNDNSIVGRVLYVEDNPANVRLMKRLLALRPGVSLLGAGTGQEGLVMAQRELPDLVLLDLHLPDMSGEELLRGLHGDSRTRTLPVAVVSADAMPVQVKRLKEAGAIAYLTKPLDLAALLRVIDGTLSASLG